MDRRLGDCGTFQLTQIIKFHLNFSKFIEEKTEREKKEKKKRQQASTTTGTIHLSLFNKYYT